MKRRHSAGQIVAKLRQRLKRRGIELICPYRKNRGRRRYHDGRRLRRHRRRWKVERPFAWLGDYRRLVVRWDCDITMCSAFFSRGLPHDHPEAVMKPVLPCGEREPPRHRRVHAVLGGAHQPGSFIWPLVYDHSKPSR